MSSVLPIAPEAALTQMAAKIAAGKAPLPRGDGTFIDLFSGCGGTSLGLMKAGWRGLFGVEKESMAFDTLAHNLVHKRTCGVGFEWPTAWLPVKPVSLQSLMQNHRENLLNLRGHVDLISGSPPCQGVSMAGRRQRSDWRNRLWQEYAKFIDIVRPHMIFMESVKGFCHAYTGKNGQRLEPFSEKLMKRLACDYHLDHVVLSCQLFGVPQRRERFFMIGVRHGLIPSIAGWANQAQIFAKFFRQESGLLDGQKMSVSEALQDLETDGKEQVPCEDAPGRMRIAYNPPRNPNAFLRRLRESSDILPNSMRLARHGKTVTEQFQTILCRAHPGKTVGGKVHVDLGNKKRTRMLLDKNQPACTIMTLPDDIIHYSEPRILTVRECARLQSFPDAFSFRGKYTTGGKRRRQECPRYTQVGNAVPPLASEGWGRYLALVDKAVAGKREKRKTA